VCPLESWLDDETMRAIAAENNLSETAFFVREGEGYALRWFTPKAEVDLCGHATLASSFVIFNCLAPELERVAFSTKSGTLTVTREGPRLVMDFPARPGEPADAPEALLRGLGREPQAVLRARDYLVLYDSEAAIRALVPDMAALMDVDSLGVIVTAPGEYADFVSRFFAPRVGVPEDPVTGSAHCTLIPYWSNRLGKAEMIAWQVSERGGELFCTDLGERVKVAGQAVLYMQGTIRL
ncbi:MAG: PhzF family phenazine biosynthesis protein, partial [Anaerolineae bacterium]|nr:PhzF family phenazine biosynthesis protein [Anaerolineae bacterium]